LCHAGQEVLLWLEMGSPGGRPPCRGHGRLEVYSHVTPTMHDETASTMERVLVG
jgi:hypothetical protein